ncbi:hypothetical protein [Hyphomicrobium sp.]|uniref:hypothetical protein n=1 Tax=Hyphomicrobium sp. TaxID=82 RepID=UPI001DBFC2DB|nr:hypothetical protein [Hyphomicrobium sp.]MBY0560730.1 hypothetical protein [Hyphomicrobium sp.]
MIVITRNGVTTVLTGWREWAVKFLVFMAAVLLFAVMAFLMLGIAITIGTVALIVIPALIIVGLFASMFGERV